MPADPHVLSYWRNVKSQNKIMGSAVRAIHEKGGDDMMQWLADQTPAGTTLMQTAAAIIYDAYEEEKGPTT